VLLKSFVSAVTAGTFNSSARIQQGERLRQGVCVKACLDAFLWVDRSEVLTVHFFDQVHESGPKRQERAAIGLGKRLKSGQTRYKSEK